MNRIKVCILQFGFARGGTDTFVINLCKAIDKKKFDITIINPATSLALISREDEVLATGVKIFHTCEMYSIKGKLKHLWLMFKFLKKERFDTFHTNVDLFNGPQLFVAWLAGIPNRVCHSHNSQQARGIGKHIGLSVKIYQHIMRYLCYRFSTRRCGCSEEAMAFLFPGFDWRDNSYPQIIYNGIDLNKFRAIPSAELISKKKEELHLSANKNILIVGHIGLQKNPLFSVEIFREICHLRNDVALIWVGKGEMQNEVQKRLSDYKILPKVHFLGQRDDVSEIMHCADVFLFPSLFEGLGIVMIEAQASGLQCVASSEVPKLADCGATIYHSLTDQPIIWANTICDILDGRLKLQVDESRLSQFSIENMVNQMQRVFTPCE